ncbi:hypothetical protein [Desulfocicer vacuolatum]|uniref:hypothetical protein n=1 Tax=Desulfocicer vacuolatum TaxID=2298 RepID=UPI001BAE621F|nr:hypothetical protein [Desulfocicer vacuolatum]
MPGTVGSVWKTHHRIKQKLEGFIAIWAASRKGAEKCSGGGLDFCAFVHVNPGMEAYAKSVVPGKHPGHQIK